MTNNGYGNIVSNCWFIVADIGKQLQGPDVVCSYQMPVIFSKSNLERKDAEGAPRLFFGFQVGKQKR